MATKTKKPAATGRDWSETLFLPKTDFPMKAGLPEREPELLKRWAKLGLYERLREEAKGRAKFVLHDGPPYANGNIHIGTGAEQDPQGRDQSLAGDDGQGHQLRAGLGLSRPAHRVEGRGGELPRQGQVEARPVGLRGDDRLPRRVPRLCRALAQRAARGVQAARRRSATGTIPTPP